MVSYTYTVILEPDKAGGFTAYCPAIPGVVTEGESVEENAADGA